METAGLVYTATVSWGGEVVQQFSGGRADTLMWVRQQQASGGLLVTVGVDAGTPEAAWALLEEPGQTGANGGNAGQMGADAASFQVVIGAGWARVDIPAEEPVSERWTRSVAPALLAAAAASREVVAKVARTKAEKAKGAR